MKIVIIDVSLNKEVPVKFQKSSISGNLHYACALVHVMSLLCNFYKLSTQHLLKIYDFYNNIKRKSDSSDCVLTAVYLTCTTKLVLAYVTVESGGKVYQPYCLPFSWNSRQLSQDPRQCQQHRCWSYYHQHYHHIFSYFASYL